MKNIHKIFSLSIFLLVLSACSDDDKGIVPSDISNTRAESREGAIILRWDSPQDKNFLYVAIEYINPRNGKTVKVNVSNFSDSLLVDNILKKDGEYTFRLMTVNHDGTGSINQQEISATALRKPAVVTVFSEKIKFEVSDLSANASDPEEGKLASLIDGKLNTFYHTNWHTTIPFPQWIEFNLPEPTEGIKFIQWNRAGSSNGNADEVSILGSNDGKNWEELGLVPSGKIPSGGGAKYESDIFSIKGKTFTKIRYNAVKPFGENTWFHMAELELHKAWYEIYDPEADK